MAFWAMPISHRLSPRTISVFIAIVFLGIGIRLSVIGFGHNFDLDSFLIVARLVNIGANVYASTMRYNYGPIWFVLLHIFDVIGNIFPNRELAFRYILVVFLGLADAGIAIVLWKRFGLPAAIIFFLNPISIIITGYHNQFDNLALLLGIVSVITFGNDFDRPINSRKFIGLILLGLSLLTKHFLFAFPFWLMVKQRGFRYKFVVIATPILIFLLGFVPFWDDGKYGIIQNVFLYRSLNNAPFYNLLVPLDIRAIFPGPLVWLVSLSAFSIIFRHRDGLESLLLYTCVVVATSPAIANQYLAIPMAFISVYMGFLSILYMAIGMVYLLIDTNGLHIYSLQQAINIPQLVFYIILIGILIFKLIRETRIQLFGWHSDIITSRKYKRNPE